MSGQGSGGEGRSWSQSADQDHPQSQENRESEGLHEPYVLVNSPLNCETNYGSPTEYPSNENKSNDRDLAYLIFSPLPRADRALASALQPRKVDIMETYRHSILTGR
jgi:hypothetical protein